MHKLFTYGILMNGEGAIGATLHGYARYRGHEIGHAIPYAFIIEQAGNSVEGSLYEDVTDEQLAHYDSIEGVAVGLYVRERVTVETQAGETECWVYKPGPRWGKIKIPKEDLIGQNEREVIYHESFGALVK